MTRVVFNSASEIWRGHGGQVSRFLFVGGATALVNLSLLFVVHDLFGLDYRIGVSVAYVIGLVFHFLMNRHFSFRASEGKMHGQLIRYVIVAACNYVVTLLVVEICVGVFSLSPYIGSVFSIAATVFSGYFLSRYWVYRL